MKDIDNKNLKVIILTMLILSLALFIGNVSFALYRKVLRGETINRVATGKLAFSYDEAQFPTNGINIVDAMPISDAEGKILTGDNKYFDFSVTGSTTLGSLNFEIVVNSLDTSNIPGSDVKIFVTKLNGNSEEESDFTVNAGVVKTYQELQTSTNQLGKIVYIGTIPDNTVDYVQKFRLRMWINENISNISVLDGKQFSVKVNVISTQD